MDGSRHAKGGPVVVSPDPRWPARAAALIEQIVAMDGTLRRVEHIGSTAVPGMTAKDVIDLQASVTDLAAAAGRLDLSLRPLGFDRSPYEQDHVPAGSGEDPRRWAKRLWVRRNHPDGDVNLHARLAGSPNERYALLFRDWFRAHPDAVVAYSAFKQALASITDELDAYTDAKDPVIDLVMAAAEPWATATGWTP